MMSPAAGEGSTEPLRTTESRGVTGSSYAFGYRSVQDKAPNTSGVYAIFGARRCVYVGESDYIRQSLFKHLNDRDRRMARFGDLLFSFEPTAPTERLARQQALIAELRPACN